MIYEIMVNDLLHHHPLLSCTICFNNYASSISKYQAKLKESMFIKWEKPDQYPFEEFLVRAICCCSSRRAMSPFILEVSTELRMDLKSRWSSSVTQALRFKFRSPVFLLPLSISLFFQNKIHFH